MPSGPIQSGTQPRAAPVKAGHAAAAGRLTAVYPPAVELRAELGAKELILGRHAGADVAVVADQTVSRRHLSLRWDAKLAAHVATDLGSSNGSWLDGVALGSASVPDNGILRTGDVLIAYERMADPSPDVAGVSTEEIPGDAAATRRLRAGVALAAADPSPVLLLGETGVGKERVAAELHRLSGRRGKLVPVNCGALSAQLVESQLFGHVRGAFTGAGEAQPGFFRAADQGTLFLDEIGELPADQQPKLLRALEQAEVVPVGAAAPVKVDVRVIAATNRDLAAAVESGEFRRDLLARISLWELRVPALRERRADILMWIDRLQRRFVGKRAAADTPPLRLSPDAAQALLLGAWQSNLRDVDRLVHHLHPLAGGVIEVSQLPPWAQADAARPQEHARVVPKAVRAPTREEFEAAYARLGGSVRALAREFGRDRRQIYRWVEAYGLKK